MSAAALAILAARRLAEKAAMDPIRWIRWTPPQLAIHSLRAPRKLFRAGNQIGKTIAALTEGIWRAAGTHPHYPTRKPPIEVWIICTTWSQAVAIMRKFHDLCPSDLIDERKSSNFSTRGGYGKDNPCVIFTNGSVIRFRTTRQGAVALQGATIHYVIIDEPTDVEIYRELDRRLLRTSGEMCVAMTPATGDSGWLRDLVDRGVFKEVHARLTVENLTPAGAAGPLRLADGTPMDAEWIASEWRKAPPLYAGVILDGDWDYKPAGIFFKCFDPARHVTGAMRLDPARGPISWRLGIDYAAAPREHGQTGVLCQVQQTRDAKGRYREAVIVVDEVVMPGVASNAQFAGELIRMLDRQGIKWRDLATVYGDNPVVSRWVDKSNIETMRCVARELGIGKDALQPRILSAKEGKLSAGMLDAGCRYLYENMADGAILIHPRCKLMIDAIETWDYGRDHPAKDRIDGLRYALKPYIFPRRGPSNAIVRIA